MAFLVSARGLPRYIKRYAQLFSWRRLGNLLAVILSLAASRLSRRPWVWGRPFMLMVEPTNRCNLRCPLCPSGNGDMTRSRGCMDLADFQHLVDETHAHVFLMMLWNQGEPFLNPHLHEMIRYAHDHHIFTFTSTNGHFIDSDEAARRVVASGLDEIVFSVDGVDQRTYAQYRVGGELATVFAGIRRLRAARQACASATPVINLQFIIMRQNEDQVQAAEQLARDLGVDKLLIKTAQVYSAADADTFLPEDPEYRRYEAEPNGVLRVKGQPERGCSVLWYSSTVNWDGTVTPCCFDKNADFRLGEAFDGEAFAAIWRGQAYMEFRRRILASRSSVAMCTNCSEGYRGMFATVKEMTG